MVLSSSPSLSQGISSSFTDVYLALLLVVVFLSLFGNIIVLTTLYTQNTNLRNRMDVFIANLAVSDIISSFSATFTLNNAKLHWNGGSATCKMSYYLMFASYAVAILTLCLASVDRFYGICRPSRHRQVFLLKNLRVTIPLIWLISALLLAPYIYAYDIEKFKLFNGETKQICLQTWTAIIQQTYFVLVIFVTLFLCPIVLFAFVFTNVVQKLREPRSTASGGNAILCKRRKQMTLMLLTMIVVHYVSWTPAIITNLAHVFGGTSAGFLNIWLIFELVHFARSAIYPLIYVFMYQNFSASLKALFVSCCTRGSQPTVTDSSVPKEPQPPSVPASSAASDRSLSYLPEDEMYTTM